MEEALTKITPYPALARSYLSREPARGTIPDRYWCGFYITPV